VEPAEFTIDTGEELAHAGTVRNVDGDCDTFFAFRFHRGQRLIEPRCRAPGDDDLRTLGDKGERNRPPNPRASASNDGYPVLEFHRAYSSRSCGVGRRNASRRLASRAFASATLRSFT